MNAVVRRYTKGMSARERLRVHELWERLEKKHGKQDEKTARREGRLAAFGKTALVFMATMEKKGVEQQEPTPDDDREQGVQAPVTMRDTHRETLSLPHA